MSTKLGLEVFLESQLDLVAGKRVGLLACPSSTDPLLRSSIDRLYAHPAINLTALYGPEHGIRGEAQAGLKVATTTDPRTGLPVYSLYGEAQSPSAASLAELDVIIIDLQDGGVRFYTYLATTLHVMRAAKASDIAVIVLDRPAPITATRIEGPILKRAYTSFVGPAPLPIRYGMTIGEVALLLNEEEQIHCDLYVVPLTGWSRAMWYDQTALPFIPSSPNLPTLDAMTLYPGTCLIEGTNLSEGRGTTRPFEYIGAPFIDAESLADTLNALELVGVRFRPVYIVPTFSKYQGEVCAGVHVYVSDRERFQPVSAMLHALHIISSLYPTHFAWRAPWAEGGPMPIDLLWGSDSLRRHFDSDESLDAFIASWQPDRDIFLRLRERYMLY